MNEQNNNLQTKKYDLEERTAKFAENIIDLMKKLSNNSINKRPIEQIIGSSGSIAANYCEANEAESKKEDFRKQWKEANELLLIFSSIIRSSRNGKIQ